jgi:hypothetical protein
VDAERDRATTAYETRTAVLPVRLLAATNKPTNMPECTAVFLYRHSIPLLLSPYPPTTPVTLSHVPFVYNAYSCHAIPWACTSPLTPVILYHTSYTTV